MMNTLNGDFRNKAFKEVATAQLQSKFLSWRPTAIMMFDHYKISDTDGRVVGHLRPPEVHPAQKHSPLIQKWDEGIIAMRKILENLDLEQFEKSELLKQLLALYIQDTIQKAIDWVTSPTLLFQPEMMLEK